MADAEFGSAFGNVAFLCGLAAWVRPDYDTEDVVNELRSMNVRAHVAQNTIGRHLSINRRTTHHAGYGMRQKIRKRIE